MSNFESSLCVPQEPEDEDSRKLRKIVLWFRDWLDDTGEGNETFEKIPFPDIETDGS